MTASRDPAHPLHGLSRMAQAAIVVVCAVGGVAAWRLIPEPAKAASTTFTAASPALSGFALTDAQLATVTSEAVEQRQFFEEIVTEGKVGVDEYQSTPIFSPYPGRVVSIFARTGEQVVKGQRLFSIQANEMVQAQNDYLAALNVLNKARSQLSFAQAAEKRLRDLYENRVTTLRELQVVQNDLNTASNDFKTAEVGLEAVRNRLRILGLRDDEMTRLQNGVINPETAINAPLNGTIIQRKIGPGQYVTTSGGEPSYIIGDLSRVWLIVQLRESDLARVAMDGRLQFRVLSHPDRTFEGRINFIGSSVDPATRRITMRADIENPHRILKPEMYASVRIINEREHLSLAVPRAAVVLEGPKASIWVLKPGNMVESRRVRTGIIDGGNIEILEGLTPGERVISRGSLFIDRMAIRG